MCDVDPLQFNLVESLPFNVKSNESTGILDWQNYIKTEVLISDDPNENIKVERESPLRQDNSNATLELLYEQAFKAEPIETYENIYNFDKDIDMPDDFEKEIKNEEEIDDKTINTLESVPAQDKYELKHGQECDQSMKTININVSKCLKKTLECEDKLYFCNQCDFKSRKKDSLLIHFESSHLKIYEFKNQNKSEHKKLQVCEHCGYEASAKGELKKHIKSAHQKETYSCQKSEHKKINVYEQCGHEASAKGELKRHMKSAHQKVTYSCHECSFKTASKGSLTNHVKCVHEKIKFKCDQCPYEAGSNEVVIWHKESVHEHATYSCSLCDVKFSYKGSIRRHMIKQHPKLESQPIFRCEKCELVFQTEIILSRHIMKC